VRGRERWVGGRELEVVRRRGEGREGREGEEEQSVFF